MRIDAYNRSVLGNLGHFRDGDIELLGARIPYRLFSAVGRVHAPGGVKGDPVLRGVRRGERASRRIERHEGAERWIGRVVDREDQRIPGVNRQLIRARGLIRVRLDAADKCESRLRERDHTTGGVGYEEAVRRGRDAVGTGAVIGPGRLDRTGRKPAESPGNLVSQFYRLGVDDVDSFIGPIGEVVGLGRLVDKTDVKRVEGTGRCIEVGVWGNGNGPEEPDRPVVISLPLVLSLVLAIALSLPV